MLRFITQGKPFARGEQQGRVCRDLALPWLEEQRRKPAPPEREVRLWVERIERVHPEGVEECRGIAAGLGLDQGAYFAVHQRFFGSFAACTSCAVRDEVGRPLIAKTDDLFAPEVGCNVLETTLPDHGYRHVHFHFAASIWTVAGMNERGLCIAMTGIPGPSLPIDGLPELVALHTILPVCATVAETVEHLRALPVNQYGFSLQIGDAAGALAMVEKTGAGIVVFEEKPGEPLVHTNHILDAEFAKRNPAQADPILGNGKRRYENARSLAKALPHTEAGLAALVADRSPRGAICQQGEEGMFTDFAVVFIPTEKRFTFWAGPPAVTQSETIRVSELFRPGIACGQLHPPYA